MSELEELRAKKQEIKDRRSKVLARLNRANTEFSEITDEFLAVDSQIRLIEEKENDRSIS